MNVGQLLVLDADLSVRLRLAESPGILRSIAMFFAHSGDSWLWAAGILLVWFFGSPFWKSRALMLGISVVITALLVLTIKFTVRRKRPEGDWGEIYRSTDPHSFPSGHAARSFMLAVLAIGLGPAWFAILLLIWAPLVGLARVAMGVHYLSDVVVGAFLGILMGWGNFNLIPMMVNEFGIKLVSSQ
jgi:undecaprenyl-diphosphatase